jgi:HEAT repeat protein
MGRRASPNSVSALAIALKERSRFVRQAAVQALCRIQTARSAEVLVSGGGFAHAPPTTDVAKCVAEMKSAALPALRKALHKSSLAAKRLACRALAKMKSRKVSSLLRRAATDKQIPVRKEAVEALGKRGRKRDIPTVARRLKDKASAVRSAAVDALRAMGRPAVSALIRALRRGKSDVRRQAAEALGEMKARRAAKALRRAVRKGDGELRKAACSALKKMGAKYRRCRKVLTARIADALLEDRSRRGTVTGVLTRRGSDAVGGRVAGVAARKKRRPASSISSLKEARRRCNKRQ